MILDHRTKHEENTPTHHGGMSQDEQTNIQMDKKMDGWTRPIPTLYIPYLYYCGAGNNNVIMRIFAGGWTIFTTLVLRKMFFFKENKMYTLIILKTIYLTLSYYL